MSEKGLSIEETGKLATDIQSEIGKVVLGKQQIIEMVFAAVLANGNILFEDFPGLAKTLMSNTLADTLGCKFKRIQFTPDLLPADITGSYFFDPEKNKFTFREGPIFCNILLADEINRAPPKTQAALLEAMQERHATVGSSTYRLPQPFFVLATQNPIEQEGTYPLPEAQIDRFMFKLKVDYPEKDEERLILRQSAITSFELNLKPVISSEHILNAQKVVNEIYVDEKIEEYVLNLVFATRKPEDYNLPELKGLIDYGGSPRASINLTLAAKSRAFLEHRGYVTPEDIRYIGMDVLRHRVILSYEAEAEEMTSEDIIQRLYDTIEIP